MLLIEGAAGIGKTRLLAEFVELARQRELLVRRGRGGPLEREMAFGVARQLLEPMIASASGADRAALFAGSAQLAEAALGVDDEAERAAVDAFAPLHGLYWLTANLAEEQPLLLVIDDAHWADRQTLRWISYLSRRIEDLAVAVLVAARSGEPDKPEELDALRADCDRLLQPAPLSQSGIAEVIESTLEEKPAAEFSAACLSVTRGNPFYLAEILRTLRADRVNPEQDAATAVEGLGPGSVARYVLIRLGRFGEDAVALARAVAVLGGAAQLRHVAALAGLDEPDARRLCDQLRGAEILAPGLPLDFVHPLVRATIYREQPEEARAVDHRRAAELLRSTGGSARDAAGHLMACPPNGDQWVVAQLGEAALEAGRAGAPESTQAYLERALEEPPDEQLPLRYELGRTLLETDPFRAQEVLDQVARQATDPGMRALALNEAAFSHAAVGDFAGTVDFYRTMLDELPQEDRERRLVLEAQLYCMKTVSTGWEAESSQRIRAVAEGLQGPAAGEQLARQALAFDRFLACEPVEGVVELAASFPPPPFDIRIIVPTFGCKILAWSGNWDVARFAMDFFIESVRATGQLISVNFGLGLLAEIDRVAGRLPDAEVEARTAWEFGRAVAPLSSIEMNAMVNLIPTLIARGDLEAAEQVAENYDLSVGYGVSSLTPAAIEIRGYLRLAQGALEDGVADLLEFGEGAERLRLNNPAHSAWRQELAPALAALDRTAEAESLIAGAELQARNFGAPHTIGTVLRSRATLEPRKRQIETLRESVAALETYGPPHELARSLVEMGAALRRDGQRSESREPLRRALELAHDCGAGGLEQRAREELVAAGSRPRSVFRTGVASLTASELRTAKLAGEGLSNVEIAQRLFVSRKTVEKHLGNAYTKLEIGSRNELATALAAPDQG